MPSVTRRYRKEEFATRGDALYEQLIRSEFEPERNGDFVAIDIDSGDFEIIDGQQRIDALHEFREGHFKLFDPIADEAAAQFPQFHSGTALPVGWQGFR